MRKGVAAPHYLLAPPPVLRRIRWGRQRREALGSVEQLCLRPRPSCPASPTWRRASCPAHHPRPPLADYHLHFAPLSHTVAADAGRTSRTIGNLPQMYAEPAQRRRRGTQKVEQQGRQGSARATGATWERKTEACTITRRSAIRSNMCCRGERASRAISTATMAFDTDAMLC